MAVQHYSAPRKPAFWSVLPAALRAQLRRFAFEVLGLGLLGAGLFAAAALISYSPADPSLNTTTSAAPTNWLGGPGALIADLLMQAFGLAASVLILPLMTWGLGLIIRGDWHLTRRQTRLRFLAWPIALVSLAGFLSLVPAFAAWPLATGLGGILGYGFIRAVTLLLGAVGLDAPPVLIALCAFAIGLVALGLSLGLRRTAWGTAWDTVSLWVFLIGEGIDSARRWLRAHRPAAGAPQSLAAPWHRRLAAALTRRREGEDTARRAPLMPRTGFAKTAPADDRLPEAAASRRIVRKKKRARTSKREITEAQPTLELEPLDDYELPPLSLLAKPKRRGDQQASDDALEQNARLLESVLEDFGVRGEIIRVRPGPVVTLYELQPAAGIKSSRVIGLADDIARSMSAISARVAVVPGRNVIGIELPNSKRETVYLRELLASPEYENTSSKLSLALGKNIGGDPVISDLTTMPHLLIAGTTGSGKSVGINSMILSLLYRLPPNQCKFIMIDPKMLELSVYEGIPHLLAPVVTDPKKAVVALKWVVREMEDRYRKMSKMGVRNISGYNARVAEALESGETITRTVQTGFDRESGQPIYEQEELTLEHLPFIVVIIDEMADLMMVAGKEIEGAVQRLAQMARAAGIHLITATQRPSVDVITGTIKANFPTRISFQVTSKVDSRTILGEQGSEQLLGQGDMLYMAGGGRIRRIHGPYVSDDEVEKVVRFLKKQGQPDYVEEVTMETDDDGWAAFGASAAGGDDLYDQALQIVVRDGKASTSYIQRRLQIGYNRAARIIERMEEEGVISPPNHAGKREILIAAG